MIQNHKPQREETPTHREIGPQKLTQAQIHIQTDTDVIQTNARIPTKPTTHAHRGSGCGTLAPPPPLTPLA
eukprot:CAMPEP_0119356522 /NCGR_PEP_ID=MMETSP1334-20130426/5117_1 /TAXON_ID=127549 /ORGANISM="Calcidiscus leptoporus, Strain RCC1130" /LENGTH=70 /DNA_ID=CAMNT_0007370581 /DNA_START=143 /DNA_END=351 /DNA_ORIENTATION=-